MNNSELKYLINDQTLSFFYQDRVCTVHKKETLLFDTLKRLLLENEVGALTANLNKNTKVYLEEAMRNKEDVLNIGISKRVKEIEASGMPIDPYLRFIQRCPTEVLLRDPYIITQVGTVDLPLTWDGDIIGYQRAAWIRKDKSQMFWVNDQNFTPFQEVVSDSPQQVGNFYWIQNVCSDAGMTYEALVKPENIQTVSITDQETYTQRCLQTKKVTLLSRLKEVTLSSHLSTTPIVEITTANSDLGPIAIRLPYNASTAAKMLEHLFNNSVSAKQLNKLTTRSVLVSTSC